MGRIAKTSRDEVLEAALTLIDETGIDALSMRRLGEALGVEAMSLYRHVPNKEAVLDGVHTLVLSKMRLPALTGRWCDDLRSLARAFRRALCAHPNAVPLFATRPAVSEASLRYVEVALGVLAEPFPNLTVRVRALQTVVAYVVGHTLSELATPGTAVSYSDLPEDTFPILSGVEPALRRYSMARELAFGLDTLLLGLEAQARANEA